MENIMWYNSGFFFRAMANHGGEIGYFGRSLHRILCLYIDRLCAVPQGNNCCPTVYSRNNFDIMYKLFTIPNQLLPLLENAVKDKLRSPHYVF